VINLSKKKVDQKSFVIGDQEEKNDEGQVNVDHLKEQLVSMITVKVGRFYLRIFFRTESFELRTEKYIEHARSNATSRLWKRKSFTHTHTIFVGSPDDIDAYVWVAHHRDGCGGFMLQSGENKFAGNQRYGAAAHHFQQHAVLRQSKIVRDGSFL